MRCARCSAELPGNAQFCLQCGTPVAAGRAGAMPTATTPAATTTLVAPPQTGSRKKLVIGAVVGLLLLGALGFGLAKSGLLGRSAKTGDGSRLVQAQGGPGVGGPLTDRNARLGDPGSLTEKPGLSTPSPSEPVDVIDYLKFLKEIERERILLAKRQTSELLAQSRDLTYPGGMADWTTNEPEQQIKATYDNFQRMMAKWSQEWDALSQRFLSKPAPQTCVALRDKYYDLLGKTTTSMNAVASAFGQALGGDPQKALESLNEMRGSGMGSASKEIGDAAVAADEELAAVCDRFRIRKDFDIQTDTGGSSLLGR